MLMDKLLFFPNLNDKPCSTIVDHNPLRTSHCIFCKLYRDKPWPVYHLFPGRRTLIRISLDLVCGATWKKLFDILGGDVGENGNDFFMLRILPQYIHYALSHGVIGLLHVQLRYTLVSVSMKFLCRKSRTSSCHHALILPWHAKASKPVYMFNSSPLSPSYMRH